MALIDDVKLALRVSVTDFDPEIQGLIDAAMADLKLAGVIDPVETDPLIKRAVITYCKAHFGYDNPEAERFQKAYDLMKLHLTLSSDYNGGGESEA